MKPGTLEDIRTKRLKVALGVPLWQAAGILSSLWYFLGEHAEDGILTAAIQADLPAHLEWAGGPDKLLGGLISSGWVITDGHSMRAAEWEDRAPRNVKDRIRKRETRMSADSPRTVRGQVAPTDECPRTNASEVSNVRGQVDEKGEEGGGGGVGVSGKRAGTKNPSGSEKAPKAKPSASYPSVTDVTLPDSLDTPEVFQALAQWIEHRRKLRKPITTDGLNIQVGKYANRPSAFVAAVQYSIGNGWQGLFEETERNGSNNGRNAVPRGTFVEHERSFEERFGLT